MFELSATNFFDLNHFQHAALFKSEEYVWKALSEIETYLKAYPLGKIEVDVPEGVFLIDAHLISIGKGSKIEPGAYIKGPCILGEDCIIRHGAYIRGNLIAGDQCVIGHDTEVKSVIMFNKAVAAHFAYLGNSILGNGVNLGAGTKCANLKLDHQEIVLNVAGEMIRTGLRKFGAIIGDNCQTGCNSVLNPGTLMGKNSVCYPCVNFGGYVPANSLIKNQTEVLIKPLKTIIKH